MIKISKRLETISSLVPNKSRILDVGCDHGLIDIYLYENNKASYIVASDVNENALHNAKKNITNKNMQRIIETRLGNGLDVIKETDKIDTVIIAGMGAHTIVDILKNNKKKLKKIETLIIQSNTKLEYLRKEIVKLNYQINDEVIIKEGKHYYTIIKFTKGKVKYTKKEYYLGPILLKKNNELFQEYKKIENRKLKNILKEIPSRKILEKYKIKKKISLYK